MEQSLLDDIINRLLEVRLVNDGIEGHVDAAGGRTRVGVTNGVRVADQLLEVLNREVCRESPGREVGEPAINGIRTRVKRRKRGFEVARRGKQFTVH